MKRINEELLGLMLLAATLVFWATSAHAQVAAKKSLTLEGARRVIAAAEAEARRLNAPGGVIAVVDDGGNLMALERLDGTFSLVPTFPSAKRALRLCSRSPPASSKN
jgi:Haem-degrading